MKDASHPLHQSPPPTTLFSHTHTHKASMSFTCKYAVTTCNPDIFISNACFHWRPLLEVEGSFFFVVCFFYPTSPKIYHPLTFSQTHTQHRSLNTGQRLPNNLTFTTELFHCAERRTFIKRKKKKKKTCFVFLQAG